MKPTSKLKTFSSNSLVKRLSIVGTTSLVLSACAASPFSKPELELQELANADEAVVYIYRPRNSLSGFGEKHPPKVFINKRSIGELPNGRFKSTLIQELENKTISLHKTVKDHAFSNVILQQDIDISGAARYFIKLEYNHDSEPSMVLVSESEALKDMSKLKPIADSIEE